MEYKENNFRKYYKDDLWKWVLLYIGVGIFAYLVIFHLVVTTFDRSAKIVKQGAKQRTENKSSSLVGWNTYKNNELGFDLRYPENLAFIEEKQQTSWSMHFYYKNNGKEGPLQISVVTDGSFLVDDNDIVGKKNIGGMTGKTYVALIGNGEFRCEQTVLYRQGTYYVFEDNCGQDKVIYERILSTFKFTNEITDVADWKTYKNDMYGFSFEYPSSRVAILPQPEKQRDCYMFDFSYKDYIDDCEVLTGGRSDVSGYVVFDIAVFGKKFNEKLIATIGKINAVEGKNLACLPEAVEKLSLGNKIAYRHYHNCSTHPDAGFLIVILDDSHFLRISFDQKWKMTTEEWERIFNSFTFTDQTIGCAGQEGPLYSIGFGVEHVYEGSIAKGKT